MDYDVHLHQPRCRAENRRLILENDGKQQEECADHTAPILARRRTVESQQRTLWTLYRDSFQALKLVGKMHYSCSMSQFWQDIRLSFRRLRKAPLFTFIAIISIALGIG